MNEDAKEFYKTLGQEIKRCREASGFSLEELGKEIGLSAKTMAELEEGKRKISAFILSMILKIVDAEPSSKN